MMVGEDETAWLWQPPTFGIFSDRSRSPAPRSPPPRHCTSRTSTANGLSTLLKAVKRSWSVTLSTWPTAKAAARTMSEVSGVHTK